MSINRFNSQSNSAGPPTRVLSIRVSNSLIQNCVDICDLADVKPNSFGDAVSKALKILLTGLGDTLPAYSEEVALALLTDRFNAHGSGREINSKKDPIKRASENLKVRLAERRTFHPNESACLTTDEDFAPAYKEKEQSHGADDQTYTSNAREVISGSNRDRESSSHGATLSIPNDSLSAVYSGALTFEEAMAEVEDAENELEEIMEALAKEEQERETRALWDDLMSDTDIQTEHHGEDESVLSGNSSLAKAQTPPWESMELIPESDKRLQTDSLFKFAVETCDDLQILAIRAVYKNIPYEDWGSSIAERLVNQMLGYFEQYERRSGIERRQE